MTRTILAAAVLLPLAFTAVPAVAETTQTVLASVKSQDFSDARGSLRSATIEYKLDFEDTTVLVVPTLGRRDSAAGSQTAAGFGATVYHNWSDRISTRSHLFVAEDAPIFAQRDIAQDLTVQVTSNTAVTVGARFARYFGGQGVSFLSAGTRRYFERSSVAYRLSRVDPEGRGRFFSHLVNLTLNDDEGEGKTRLWLSSGTASVEPAQLEENVSGDDLGALLQRTQPLTDRLGLVISAGLSSYARPEGRITATTFGLGVSAKIN